MVWSRISQTTQYVVILDSGVNRLGVLYIATQIYLWQIFYFGFVFTRPPKHLLVKPFGEPIVHHPAPAGDEIETLNDSWLFLIWSSDHSPCLSNSVCSRGPIAVIPKSLYLIDSNEVNLTVRAATTEIVTSFNRLSNMGVKIRDLPSMGAVPAIWLFGKGWENNCFFNSNFFWLKVAGKCWDYFLSWVPRTYN